MYWQLDRAHTEISFSVRHLMVSKVRGVFRDFDAVVEINEEAPERSKVSARIDAASIDTRETNRDAHLRSADFLDAETHPYLTFESKTVHRRNDRNFEVTGDLTIRGITREITLKGELEGPVTDPRGERRLGIELHGELDREDFGLTWNMALEAGGVLVGRNVTLSIEAEITAAVQPVEANSRNFNA